VGVPVLIISGSLGSGKTTVLREASDLLIERKTRHAIDVDGLSIAWPQIRDAPYNDWIMFRNLACVWANYAREGIDRLVVALSKTVRSRGVRTGGSWRRNPSMPTHRFNRNDARPSASKRAGFDTALDAGPRAGVGRTARTHRAR